MQVLANACSISIRLYGAMACVLPGSIMALLVTSWYIPGRSLDLVAGVGVGRETVGDINLSDLYTAGNDEYQSLRTLQILEKTYPISSPLPLPTPISTLRFEPGLRKREHSQHHFIKTSKGQRVVIYCVCFCVCERERVCFWINVDALCIYFSSNSAMIFSPFARADSTLPTM